jgi:hypothetical protein
VLRKGYIEEEKSSISLGGIPLRQSLVKRTQCRAPKQKKALVIMKDYPDIMQAELQAHCNLINTAEFIRHFAETLKPYV